MSGLASVLLTAEWPSGESLSCWLDDDKALHMAKVIAGSGAVRVYLTPMHTAIVWKWKDADFYMREYGVEV